LSNSPRQTRTEVVGIFSTRAAFDQALRDLQAGGFDRRDISVLASHDSIDAAAGGQTPWREKLVALVGELKYEGPLVTAGLIAMATGPVGAAIAAVIAAGVGGAAAVELMGELTAKPHSADFAAALAAGSVLLWVDAPEPAQQVLAAKLLSDAGGLNVHTHARPV